MKPNKETEPKKAKTMLEKWEEKLIKMKARKQKELDEINQLLQAYQKVKVATA